MIEDTRTRCLGCDSYVGMAIGSFLCDQCKKTRRRVPPTPPKKKTIVCSQCGINTNHGIGRVCTECYAKHIARTQSDVPDYIRKEDEKLKEAMKEMQRHGFTVTSPNLQHDPSLEQSSCKLCGRKASAGKRICSGCYAHLNAVGGPKVVSKVDDLAAQSRLTPLLAADVETGNVKVVQSPEHAVTQEKIDALSAQVEALSEQLSEAVRLIMDSMEER